MAMIRKLILKNGRASFEVRIQLRDTPEIKRRFHSEHRARLFALETEFEIREGRYDPDLPTEKWTLQDAVKRYFERIMPRKRPRTQEAEAPRLQWWSSRLGSYRLTAITGAMLSECRDELLQAGKSAATVRRYFSLLRHVFNIAITEWGWAAIERNPVTLVKLPKEPAGRERLLTTEEWGRLFVACRESEKAPYLAALVALLLLTGCRLREILQLPWGEVRWEEHRLLIPPERNKGKQNASIPLSDAAMVILEELRDSQRAAGIISPYVFPRADDCGKPIFSVKHAWSYALDKAGIENFRLHDIRHAAATLLAAGGGSVAELRGLLRHKDFSLLARYAHNTPETLRAISSKLEAASEEIRMAGEE